MNEIVRQKLREIVLKHGLPPLSDPRLCESLLKDYCGQYKKEIFVLVCAVREQVATDLLTSEGGVPQELLHPLLIKRLQNNLALTEDASKWAVESWSLALAGLTVDEAETLFAMGKGAQAVELEKRALVLAPKMPIFRQQIKRFAGESATQPDEEE